MKTKCFDSVSDIVENVSMHYSELRIDSEKYEILKEYCDSIDVLAKEFEATAVTAEIDVADFTITIKVVCEDIIVKFGSRRYYDLVERAMSFGFYSPGEDVLINEFTFPSVWQKKGRVGRNE